MDKTSLKSPRLNFQRIQDRIADVVRERIIVGEYERGRRLKQMELAAELGVSVTPIREAFGILEAEGYLVGASHKGAKVPILNQEQAREVRDLRLLLEQELIRHALPKMDKNVVAAAREIHDACAAEIPGRGRIEVRRLNYRFHFIFYELAERPQTLEFVRVLWAKYPFHDLDAIEQRQVRMQAEHEVFLDCLEKGDFSGALKAMDQHIRVGWSEFEKDREVPK